MPQVPHKIPVSQGKRAALDLKMAEFAGARDGVMSRQELLELGFLSGAIESHLANRQLVPIHWGVYAVGHKALSRRGSLRAALLACGDAAVLSHRTAADLWGISPRSSPLIEITGPTRRRGGHGFRYCQSRLHPEDTTEVEGFPVTSIPRTLLDLAGVVDRPRLERAVDRAVRRRLLDQGALNATIERNRGKKGRKLLTSVIASFDPATSETRSNPERKFLKLVTRYNLPKPLVNVLVEGFLVDFYWSEHNVIVEIDCYATHGSEKAFHSDRERDATLSEAGYRVLRFTDVQLDREPTVVARRVSRAIGN
jgi:very-short-patch-repair endonuclease